MANLVHLQRLIRDAVKAAIEPGVTGVVVSGGIDSSTICTYARQLAGDIPTFTGWYESEGFDERRYARLVAGPNHHEILIQPSDFETHFDNMVHHLRPPYQGMGTFGQYMVGRYIANNTNVKVVLSGEGADELFGGYARLMKVAWGTLPEGYRDYKVPIGYPRDIAGALAYDWQRLPDLLAVDDQCMAAHGLEARAPFCDEPIVDYAHRLPYAERIAKWTLKSAMRDIVPAEILERTDKMGFPCPLVQWANGPCRDFVYDRIGYLPDPDKPWERGWWYDMLNTPGPMMIGDRLMFSRRHAA